MKTAVVVGSESGIGKEINNVLQRRNINTIGADISIVMDKQTANNRYVDATDKDSVNEFVKYLSKSNPTIDYLFITIGAIDQGKILEYTIEEFQWMLNTNLMGPFSLVKEIVPLMIKSESAKIMLTGSAAGFGIVEQTYDLLPYIVSKHALHGYFKVLKAELLEMGIQVSLLLPNRITGGLSENSARMRALSSSNKDLSIKGKPLQNTISPDLVTESFINQFFEGRTYITNNPEMMLAKLQAELDILKNDFSKD